MSKSRDQVKLAVGLVRKGATILAEPCPQCGGIQVRYLGKVHCTSHEDLVPVLKAGGVSLENVLAEMKGVLLTKLSEYSSLLENEKDEERQGKLVGLMTECFGLLQKLLEKRQSP